MEIKLEEDETADTRYVKLNFIKEKMLTALCQRQCHHSIWLEPMTKSSSPEASKVIWFLERFCNSKKNLGESINSTLKDPMLQPNSCQEEL